MIKVTVWLASHLAPSLLIYLADTEHSMNKAQLVDFFFLFVFEMRSSCSVVQAGLSIPMYYGCVPPPLDNEFLSSVLFAAKNPLKTLALNLVLPETSLERSGE